MFDIFLDGLKKILKSRLIPIALVFLVLFGLIINRLFTLQIVEGPTYVEEFDYRQTQTREVKSTRGNIYDRNGKLLASNALTYSVVMEDSNLITSNEDRNKVIHQLINIIEGNNDSLDNEFYIDYMGNGDFRFNISGSALTRFKKNVYAYVLEDGELTQEQSESNAKAVYNFLKWGTGDSYTTMFGISDDYTIEETLKIMSIRYALFCNYPKYFQVTVASDVSDTTVAAVMENSANMPGVTIKQQTHRIYHDSPYFAHILGYTGLISANELEEYNSATDDYYNSTDIIGKTGFEKEFEKELGGIKGSEIVSTNTYGRVTGVVDRVEPVAGNDIYITIDADLQKSSYHILEKRIAGVLIDKIQPDMNYGSKGESASDILIPIYEVYYALIDNNIIDINNFTNSKAGETEKIVYQKFLDNLDDVFNQLDTFLSPDNTITNNMAGDMEEYLDYFYRVLKNNGIILESKIPDNDSTFASFKRNRISLSEFLNYTLTNNYVDLAKLGVESDYNTSDELYQKLIDFGKNILINDPIFHKQIYRHLIFSYRLTGSEICLLLFEQNVLEYREDDINRIKAGNLSAYNFMISKIKSLEITPAMLALEPSSGSIVITDVNNGDVLALVTYPSYDNNMLANKVDPDYYSKLLNDSTKPLINRPLSERTAPGSTFKMVTAVAGLEEGVVTPYEKIRDLGVFDKITPSVKCHIHPGSHGLVDMPEAIRVSCNYYFYELGYRLSTESSGRFNDQLGLNRIEKYAKDLGLGVESGVELYESSPRISDNDVVRSAIGQGTNAYTPIQLSRYVTTIANTGVNYKLTLLDKTIDKDKNIIMDNKGIIDKKLSGFKASTWESIQKGMYSVVNVPYGSVYRLYNDLGIDVAGKTGTSQVSKVNSNNALFVSYAPYEEPEISVVTVIPHGHTSGNAAELAKDIYKLYFNLEDKEELLNDEASVPEHNIAAFSD